MTEAVFGAVICISSGLGVGLGADFSFSTVVAAANSNSASLSRPTGTHNDEWWIVPVTRKSILNAFLGTGIGLLLAALLESLIFPRGPNVIIVFQLLIGGLILVVEALRLRGKRRGRQN